MSRKTTSISTPFDYCSCTSCKVVRSNSLRNTWWHVGHGSMTPEEMLACDNKTKKKGVFINPALTGDFQIGSKPRRAIWLSNGSWSFDPYCDGGHQQSVESKDYIPTKTRVMVVKNPKNILVINDKDSLDKFIDQYTVEGLDKKSLERKARIQLLKCDYMYALFIQAKNYERVVDNIRKSSTKLGIDFDIVVSFIRSNCLSSDINVRTFAKHFFKVHSDHKERLQKDYESKKKSAKDSDDDQGLAFSLEIRRCTYGEYILEKTFEHLYNHILIEELEKIQDTREKKYGQIDWNKVWNKGYGYWGVSIGFRKVSHIGLNIFDQRYYWHSGWDSESLCIFDTRAFDDVVVLEDVEI